MADGTLFERVEPFRALLSARVGCVPATAMVGAVEVDVEESMSRGESVRFFCLFLL